MKKLLLSLGALTAVIAPVAAVVACGTEAPAPTPGPSVQESIAALVAPKAAVQQVKGSLLTEALNPKADEAKAEIAQLSADIDKMLQEGNLKSGPATALHATADALNPNKASFETDLAAARKDFDSEVETCLQAWINWAKYLTNQYGISNAPAEIGQAFNAISTTDQKLAWISQYGAQFGVNVGS